MPPAPKWLSTQEQRAWRAFQTMTRELDGTLERQLNRDSKLSSADYALLVVLSETKGHVVRARELRHVVGWDRSRLAHQVRRMEQRGLIRRTDCPTDARGTMVELTPRGLGTIQAAAPGHVEAVRRYFIDLLSPEELELLAGLGEKVAARIAEEGSPCEA